MYSNLQAIDTSEYCLAHLFTKRDFGCVAGLGHVGKLCASFANTAFTVLRKEQVYYVYYLAIFGHPVLNIIDIITGT